MNGAESIGELEFARICRDFGLPEPARQSRRTGPHSTFHLDAEWPSYGVVVEIDGIHHLAPGQVLADSLR